MRLDINLTKNNHLILYHLHILDESMDSKKDLSEYPC